MRNIKSPAIIILCLLLIIAFAGCSNDKNEETNGTETSTVSSEKTTDSSVTTTSNEESSEIVSNNENELSKENQNQTTTAQTTQRQIVSVTIPEGFSFMQIAERLESKGVCSAKDFYETAQSYSVKSFSVPNSSDRCFRYEGYLFPDTYEFYKNDDPKSVLIKMLNNYAAKSGMPTDKELIIASIIEKEVRSESHMKMVASVFYNRLDQGMKLESDPTREYVNDFITGNSLLSSDTSKYASLYNTYKCKIPAGPICSPGKKAIEAAQDPANSEYLYFFFGNDNDNHYSKTYEEHEAQMKEYGVQYGN